MKLNSSIALQAAQETFQPGDEVMVRGQKMKGVVRAREGNKITVRFQNGTELTRDAVFVSKWDENSIAGMWKDEQS